jgi:hypothetical protein
MVKSSGQIGPVSLAEWQQLDIVYGEEGTAPYELVVHYCLWNRSARSRHIHRLEKVGVGIRVPEWLRSEMAIVQNTKRYRLMDLETGLLQHFSTQRRLQCFPLLAAAAHEELGLIRMVPENED